MKTPIFILAAGEGTRMFPYDSLMPKALLPLSGQPFINWIISQIDRGLFDIRVGVLKKDLPFFKWELRDAIGVQYVTIETPRGTAGILKDYVTTDCGLFGVWYGDCMVGSSLYEIYSKHVVSRTDGTLVMSKPVPTDYGIVEVENEFVKKFNEHGTVDEYFWTGIGLFETESILTYLDQNKDLAKDVIPAMVKDGKKFSTFVTSDYYDIGTYSSYVRAKKIFDRKTNLREVRLGSKTPNQSGGIQTSQV